MTRTCSKCEHEKYSSDFHIRKTGKFYSWCKKCCTEDNKLRCHKDKIENPEKHKRKLKLGNEAKKLKSRGLDGYYKKADLKKTYGITIEEYKKMLYVQNGVCAICEKECVSGRNLAVDHCHETGNIRGLLCSNCNPGLGHFKDSIKLLDRAIQYLSKES